MGKNRKGMEYHDFFCLKCGNKGIPIGRKQGFQHGKFHRKKLYCIHCKEEVNHIECKNDEEVYEFQCMFEEGHFLKELELVDNEV